MIYLEWLEKSISIVEVSGGALHYHLLDILREISAKSGRIFFISS